MLHFFLLDGLDSVFYPDKNALPLQQQSGIHGIRLRMNSYESNNYDSGEFSACGTTSSS